MDRVSQAMNLVGNAVGGKYTLQRVLGIGGMGAVYEAVHAYTNRRVAVKILEPEYAASSDASARFLQEAQAPSSIGHPNIVEVLDAGEDPARRPLRRARVPRRRGHGERGGARPPRPRGAPRRDPPAPRRARRRPRARLRPPRHQARQRLPPARPRRSPAGEAPRLRHRAQRVALAHGRQRRHGDPPLHGPRAGEGAPRRRPRRPLVRRRDALPRARGRTPLRRRQPQRHHGEHHHAGRALPRRAAPRPLEDPRPRGRARALAKSPDARWADAAHMAAQLSATPERLEGALKITSTLRNRAGVVSEMRPSTPSRTLEVASALGAFGDVPPPKPPARTGTLTDDPSPTGETLPSLPATPTLPRDRPDRGARARAGRSRAFPRQPPPRRPPLRAQRPARRRHRGRRDRDRARRRLRRPRPLSPRRPRRRWPSARPLPSPAPPRSRPPRADAAAPPAPSPLAPDAAVVPDAAPSAPRATAAARATAATSPRPPPAPPEATAARPHDAHQRHPDRRVTP